MSRSILDVTSVKEDEECHGCHGEDLRVVEVYSHGHAVTFCVECLAVLIGLLVRNPVVYDPRCRYEFKDERCQYPGPFDDCDKTPEACRERGNIENFGGFPGLPK